MHSKASLAAVIITKDEEDKIARCLESVKWADELIVVDDLSTDRTVEICQQFGAKVISHKSDGFLNQQCNIGRTKAVSDWILEMDADEIVGEELKQAIQKVLTNNSDYAGYKFKRKNYFLGHFMQYGGYHDGYYTKLFRRNLGEYIGRSVHINATLCLKGKVGIINADIEHYPFQSIAQFVQRQNYYTSVEAKIMQEDKGVLDEKLVRYQMIRRPLRLFWKLYLKKKGYKDGRCGLIFAILNAWKHFLLWAKYWELVGNKNENNLSR